ncbi:MAG: FAD-dependent oxidoreductase [Candidatus Fermentibacteraceae bacterium]|nr:FAD-dependent oxidoreductase [Candidatus Fermentibacteraceae bacterium]
MKVVVLGAGLAGLSAAEELTRRGHEVVIIEKESHPGGLASTIKGNGFEYDLGPHRFHTSNNEILDFVRGLPGIDLLELNRVSRIRLLDRYFDYPLALSNVLSTMPLHRGVGMMLSFLAEKARALFTPREQHSFEGWVLGRFGRGLYELYLAPYNKKLWGIEPSQLSADWASQRITVPSLAGLVRETVLPSKETVRSLVSTFHYPRGGIGEISRALASRITEMGGSLLCSNEPLSIEREGNGWRIALPDGHMECSKVINTIPVNHYTGLLGDLLPEDVHRSASRLNFRAIVFLSVLLDGDIEPSDHWIYTSEDRYLFNRLSISKNFDPNVPSQIVFEYSCQVGDEVWDMPMDELLRSTVPHAEHLGLFSSNMVRGADICRQSHAYPIYDLNYAENAARVLNALEDLPDSVTCGRQGLFRYNNMDHSIEMGKYAALEILGEASVKNHFNWSENTWADG